MVSGVTSSQDKRCGRVRSLRMNRGRWENNKSLEEVVIDLLANLERKVKQCLVAESLALLC